MYLNKKNIACSIFSLTIYFFGSVHLYAQDSTTNSAINNVISKVENVLSSQNFADLFVPDSNVALPFGIRKQIGSARYIVAIDSCKFTPVGAFLNAYAAIDFPGTTKKLAFEAKNIKFNPEGVVGGSQSRLMLVSEHSIRINNMVTLKLKNDGNNWVEWDCNGFKAISLKGHFIFNKGKLISDSTQTKDSVVTASFQIYTNDIHNFITQVSITPFTLQGLEKWSFTVTNATVDLSELANAPSMIFPPGYSNPNLISPSMWSGFYLQSVKVKLPSEISKAGTQTELVANNLLIDNMGVTGLFQVNNLLSLSEGSMSGWDYSIEELGVGFLCNNLNAGHIKGKVNIPAFQINQGFRYDATIYHNPITKEADYTFIVSPSGNVNFDVFSAQVSLNNTSQIIISKSNGLFKPIAILNGNIGFNHSKFSTNGGQLLFQDLTIITDKPYLTHGIFTLHNIGGNTTTSKYPTTVNDISFGISHSGPIISLGVGINILDNVNSGFSATTTVSLVGKIDAQPINYYGENPVTCTKTKWKFDKLLVNSISLGLQTSVFTLNGVVFFRENDPTYGDGFYGKVLFSIKNVLPSPASITACFGNTGSYRYFYLDAVVPTNIPLGTTPISISRIMGGMYYHMMPQQVSQNQLISLSKNQNANSATALTYTPDNSVWLGFKAGVGFAYSTSSKTANGNVMLEVNFTSSGGLGYVSLGGDIYFMSSPDAQEKAPVAGTVLIQYDVVNKIFDANATIKINAYNKITGTGFSKVHIEPNLWYVCIGKPSNRNKINFIGLVSADAYFMAGNSIEPAPPPPPEITKMSGYYNPINRNDNELSSGKGFCAGATISSRLDARFGLDIFNVYGEFGFMTGFDMMMVDFGPTAYCQGDFNSKAGLNGYIISGTLYLYMSGNVGISIAKKDFSIFNSQVAALVYGKTARPFYFSGQFLCNYNILGGLYKGNINFNYTYGTDCIPVKN